MPSSDHPTPTNQAGNSCGKQKQRKKKTDHPREIAQATNSLRRNVKYRKRDLKKLPTNEAIDLLSFDLGRWINEFLNTREYCKANSTTCAKLYPTSANCPSYYFRNSRRKYLVLLMAIGSFTKHDFYLKLRPLTGFDCADDFYTELNEIKKTLKKHSLIIRCDNRGVMKIEEIGRDEDS